MPKEQVFEIIRNFRKPRLVKHRNKKYVPPITLQTRRMSRIKDQYSNDLDDIAQEIQQFSLILQPNSQVILKDLTSENGPGNQLRKQIDAEDTPFGDCPAQIDSFQCFLSINQF